MYLAFLYIALRLTGNLRKVYVFEIVEVVSALEDIRQYKLKLRCRDEAKGPVTALCGMNGYLVSSMGQKVCSRSTALFIF